MLGFKDVKDIKYLARACLSRQSRPRHSDGDRNDFPARHHRRRICFALWRRCTRSRRRFREQYQTVPQSKDWAGCLPCQTALDSLVGLFAAGLAPTGAKDPFGLRRAAIGVVQPLIEHDLDFDLAKAVKESAKTQPIEVSAEAQKQILEFIAGRLKVVLGDMGFKHDVVEAVLAAQSNNPAGTVRAVKQLSAWVGREDWSSILDGFARCVRIIRSAGSGQWTVDR